MTPFPQRPEGSGADAIEAAMAELYPGVRPLHVGYRDGTLSGSSAYPALGHWHYVTYGLTELAGAGETTVERSGRGFELTLRAPRPVGQQAPPMWPFRVLEQVARFIDDTGTVLADGHRMDLRQPITGDGTDSSLTALLCTTDPELAARQTPNGRVDFLQLVGATADELHRAQQTTTSLIIIELSSGNPLLITDPDR